jgi:2-keto-4-pentenoate hydratase/2-oxohepta-3-ene-1,7-dioic acid hydratase in catechol pathway
MSIPVHWALGYFSRNAETFTGLVVGDKVRDLRSDAVALGVVGLETPTGTRALLEAWDTAFGALESLSSESSGTWFPTSELTVLAPLCPGQILQAGANYRTHVIDLAVTHADLSNGRTEDQVRREAAAMMDERKAEGIPYFFIGLQSALTGPYDTVTLPSYSQKHDWELELAAVIGLPGFHLTPANALDHVAAYVIVNDLTTRDLVFRRDMPEIGSDWFRAKNAPGFLPIGPWLVPAPFVGDPQKLHLELKLNGEIKQDAETSDMLFTVAELVSAASQTVALKAGDLILTGSPAGNGAHWGRLLQDGDAMESTIDGLGQQHTRVVAEVAE